MTALTARELEVVREIARGSTDKQAGVALGLSSITIRNHQRSIRGKLGITNRTQLTLWAIREGIVPAPEIRGELFEAAI